jgi:hypothetical protein
MIKQKLVSAFALLTLSAFAINAYAQDGALPPDGGLEAMQEAALPTEPAAPMAQSNAWHKPAKTRVAKKKKKHAKNAKKHKKARTAKKKKMKKHRRKAA